MQRKGMSNISFAMNTLGTACPFIIGLDLGWKVFVFFFVVENVPNAKGGESTWEGVAVTEGVVGAKDGESDGFDDGML